MEKAANAERAKKIRRGRGERLAASSGGNHIHGREKKAFNRPSTSLRAGSDREARSRLVVQF